jgi:hypothetical protein
MKYGTDAEITQAMYEGSRLEDDHRDPHGDPPHPRRQEDSQIVKKSIGGGNLPPLWPSGDFRWELYADSGDYT